MIPAQAAAQAIINKLLNQRSMTVEEAAEVIASAYPRNDSMYDPMTAALWRIADALESPALTAICSAADSLKRIADHFDGRHEKALEAEILRLHGVIREGYCPKCKAASPSPEPTA